MSDLGTSTPNPRRRFHWRRLTRFSLRTFLIASVAAAIGVWWYFSPKPRQSDRTLPGGVRVVQGVSALWKDENTGETVEQRHGALVVRNAQGRYLTRGAFVDGVAHGDWTYYHENGRRQRAGRIEHGVPVGRWREWHENGQLATVVNYGAATEWVDAYSDEQTWRSGRDGTARAWWNNGQPRYVGKHANDLRSGEWTFWDRDGRTIAEGTFRAGLKHGAWREMDAASGLLVDVHYLMDHRTPPRDTLLADMTAALASDDWETRHNAIDTLAYLGPDGARAIAAHVVDRAAISDDDDERRFAFQRLRDMGSEAGGVAETIEPFTQSGTGAERIDALMTLFVVVPDRRNETLARLLQVAMEVERTDRFERLHWMADLNSLLLPSAEVLLKDNSADTSRRQAVLQLLRVLADKDAVESTPLPTPRQRIRELLQSCLEFLPPDLQDEAHAILDEIEHLESPQPPYSTSPVPIVG